MRTDRDAYPSGWAYKLHYGATGRTPRTLDDGTIRRYDNSHEDTKGARTARCTGSRSRYNHVPGDGRTLGTILGEIPKSELDVK